jgi:peptidoglycan/LPS O-acetylase OafA/YrhL
LPDIELPAYRALGAMNVPETGHQGPIERTDDVRNTDQSPATAPIASSGERYRGELDGIRALCIIFTIFNHVPARPWWINGTIGVDVFFALSGWLITTLLIREREKTGKISLGSFYIRRLFRILPLYYLMVAVYTALTLAGAKAGGTDEWRHAIGYMLSLTMEYRPASAGTLFGHAWTLGIEEKFYIFWPLILVCTIGRPAVSLTIATIAVVAVALASAGDSYIVRGYAGLLFGTAFSVLVLTHPILNQILVRQRTALPYVLLIILGYAASLYWPQLVICNVVVAFGAALLIGYLWFHPGTLTARLLSIQPMPWLGRLTYAIYLIQTLSIRMVLTTMHRFGIPESPYITFILSYAVSIAAAWVLHATFEKPAIRLGKYLAKRCSGGAAGNPTQALAGRMK